jgi:GNAT superfamily N-acetyltransferase
MAARLRAGSAGDAPDLTRLFLAARREAMPYLPELHTDEETAEWMERDVLRTHEVAVAEADGRIAGFAALDGDLLGHLYVDPPRQGQGIGSALFDCVKKSRPNGFRFWVFQRNEAARRFYEARGGRVVELTDGAGNEEREPDALYEWLPPTRS